VERTERYTAGIDCGTHSIKAVVADGERWLATSEVKTGLDIARLAEEAYHKALTSAGLSAPQLRAVFATGAGREAVEIASSRVSEISAAARAAQVLCPEARTLIEAGAEEVRVIKLVAGRVVDFALNDKCAASCGTFVEIMARALELELSEVGRLSLQASGDLTINARCVVFAESEMIGLIHRQVPRAEIVRAVHHALAERVVSLVRRVGLEPPVLLAGGLGRDQGFAAALEKKLGLKLLTLEQPEFIGALGAALAAADSLRERVK